MFFIYSFRNQFLKKNQVTNIKIYLKNGKIG